jgi:predicted outer membrane repeat protein
LASIPKHRICLPPRHTRSCGSVVKLQVQLPAYKIDRCYCSCCCSISWNSPGGYQTIAIGGAVYAAAAASLSGCTFANNTSNVAGALALYATSTVDNCTFAGNSCAYQGGAVSMYGTPDTVSISNSVFTDNGCGEVSIATYYCVVTFCMCYRSPHISKHIVSCKGLLHALY